jgi:hypothetical protein
MPGLRVSEFTGPRTGVVVSRMIHQDGTPVRRWDVLEPGTPEEDWLPRRIRVSRLQSGHRTDFVRTSAAVPVAGPAFDVSMESLREAVEARLAGREE